jgi:N-acetylglucosaminyldiphosphoundecaprenol N-acetyl-beta-D-mannosaminyltransferase
VDDLELGSLGDSGLTRLPSTSFNDVPIHQLGTQELVDVVLAMLMTDRSHVIHFLAAHPLTIARRDLAFRDVLREADVNIPDGLPLVWAVRAAGGRATRITASDGLLLLSAATAGTDIRHFFFGSTDMVLRRLTANLATAHDGLRIAGTRSPPFRPITDDEFDAMSQEIRAAWTDILWVGMGAPKQNVVAEQLRTRGAAPVIITIGAAFDFAAGVKRRAPPWMQSIGLEWLFRLLQEPRRLARRYVVSNSQFVVDAARAAWVQQRSVLQSSRSGVTRNGKDLR